MDRKNITPGRTRKTVTAQEIWLHFKLLQEKQLHRPFRRERPAL